jgi:hypothetical protein
MIMVYNVFLAKLFFFFPVTLDYRIDFYIQGSNYNIFYIKTFQAVIILMVYNVCKKLHRMKIK